MARLRWGRRGKVGGTGAVLLARDGIEIRIRPLPLGKGGRRCIKLLLDDGIRLDGTAHHFLCLWRIRHFRWTKWVEVHGRRSGVHERYGTTTVKADDDPIGVFLRLLEPRH